MKRAFSWPDDGVILYDGVCLLCSRWVRFVARRDRAVRLRFTPIQSDYGRALAVALGIDPADPDTNALIWNGCMMTRSDAALAVLGALPGWRWATILRFVPPIVRDALYGLIARNRYRVFGQSASCDLGGALLRDRVLTHERVPGGSDDVRI